jgi:DNA-binding transcriptional ArsR family regulator
MQLQTKPLLLCLLMSLGAYGASASGDLAVGSATLVLENGYETDCVESVSGLCLASLQGDSLGDSRVDAYERITFVGVAIDTPLLFLPDGTLFVRPSDHSVKHPIYRILIDDVGTLTIPIPVLQPFIYFDETEHGFGYDDPGVDPMNSTPGERRSRIPYGDDGAEYDVIDRERIQPFQSLGNTTWDSRVDRVSNDAPCSLLDSIGCRETLQPVGEAVMNATPDVNVGFSFVEADFTDDPSAFPSHGALGDRASLLDAPLARSATRAPAGPLAPASSGPRPLSQGAPAGGPASDPIDAPAPRGRVPHPAPVTVQNRSPPAAHAGAQLLVSAAAFSVAVVLAALFARIRSKDGALASGRRQALLAVLHQEGPMTLAALARKLGVDRTTVEHHARHLERLSMLRAHKQGRLVVLALPEQPVGPIVPAFKPLRVRLLDEIRSSGGSTTQQEIARLTSDVPKRTRNHALRELQLAGIVEIVHGMGPAIIRLRAGGSAV